MKKAIEDAITLLENHQSSIVDISSPERIRIDIILSVLSKIGVLEPKLKVLFPYFFELEYEKGFLNKLNGLNNVKSEEARSLLIDDIYSSCAILIKECVLYGRYSHYNKFVISTVPSSTDRHIVSFFNNLYKKINSDSFNSLSDLYKNKLKEINSSEFDIKVLGYYIYGRSFESFRKYEKLIEDSEQNSLSVKEQISIQKDDLSNFINRKREEVNRLAKQLDEQKIAFNFVGLSQGFESLLKKKRNSQIIVLSLLFFIGIFLFIPLFTYIELNQIKNQSDDLFNWKMFLPFVSIELISLYLFRVVLTHYNSIKTQIMQLELRQTLCQFIQSYVEYAKEIKEKDSASLEKFENLIFSSILSTPDKVPSTFDGLEQLSNFIKNIKSGN